MTTFWAHFGSSFGPPFEQGFGGKCLLLGLKGVQRVLKKGSKSGPKMSQKVVIFGDPQKVKLQPTEHFFHEKSLFCVFWSFFLFRSLRKGCQNPYPFFGPFFRVFRFSKKGSFFPLGFSQKRCQKMSLFSCFHFGWKKVVKKRTFKKWPKSAKKCIVHPDPSGGSGPSKRGVPETPFWRGPKGSPRWFRVKMTPFGGPKGPLFGPLFEGSLQNSPGKSTGLVTTLLQKGGPKSDHIWRSRVTGSGHP